MCASSWGEEAINRTADALEPYLWVFLRIRESRWPYIGVFCRTLWWRNCAEKVWKATLTDMKRHIYTRQIPIHIQGASVRKKGVLNADNDGWWTIITISQVISSLICPSWPLHLFLWFHAPFSYSSLSGDSGASVLFAGVRTKCHRKLKWKAKAESYDPLQREHGNKGTLWSIWVILFPALILGLDQSLSQSLGLTSQLRSVLCPMGWTVVLMASAACL